MAIHEIFVTDKTPKTLHNNTRTKSQEVYTAKVYLFEGITREDAERLQREGLTDPIIQKSVLNAKIFEELNQIEVAYFPEVSDPDSQTLFKIAELLGIKPTAVSSSTIYASEDNLDREIFENVIKQNETILEKKRETLLFDKKSCEVEVIPISKLNDSELLDLSKQRSLSLNVDEMRVIQNYFLYKDREPTDIELETFAQTWSEHNGHKTFKAILLDEKGEIHKPLFTRLKEVSEKYFKKAGVVTAFKDNSGGIGIDEKWVLIVKIETHITPTGIEPYGANMTLLGGSKRDIVGTGQVGELLFGLVIMYWAPPDMDLSKIPEGALHPRYVLENAIQGQRDYGNPMGVPTSIFSLGFMDDFVGKPMAMGGNVGRIEREYAQKGEPQIGDLIVSVGGKTGRDGIHGATVSSAEATSETATKHTTAVQLGDPIEEKKFSDALIACKKAGIIRAVTDCGGGGYSSSIGEIGEKVGVEVNLDKVKLKVKGLSPWEIWLSESQERMVVAVDPNNIFLFVNICKSFDVSADVIGHFTGDKLLTLKFDDKIVGQLEMEFLHNGLPQRVMKIETPKIVRDESLPNLPQGQEEYAEILLNNLSHVNVCSKEDLHRKYDLTVQARTALSPYTGVFQDMPNDAVVNCPVEGSPTAAIVAHGLSPRLSSKDPYWGTVWGYALAASKFASVGGNIDRAAIVDNFVSPVPDPVTLGKVNEEMNALVKMIEVCQTPAVSGKDSLSSTFKTKDGEIINIPPFVNTTVMGVIDNVENTISADIKEKGSTLVLIGKMDTEHLGGSIYFQNKNITNNEIPKVDIDQLPATLKSLYSAIQTKEIMSCKSVGEGGLMATISQMCFGGDCGADIDILPVNASRPDFALFNETAGCLVVEVKDEETARILFENTPHIILGSTTEDKKIIAKNGDKNLLEVDLYDLKNAWQKPMKSKIAA